jgi:hypothetical protein
MKVFATKTRQWWAVWVAIAVMVAAIARVSAHEIPADVIVRAFVRAESGQARMVVRAPLETFRDLIIPLRREVFLDRPAADAAIRTGAELWIAQAIRLYQDNADLGAARVSAVRVALPSEPFFESYEVALRQVRLPAHDPATDIVASEAVVDVLLEWSLPSSSGRLALETELARLGLRTQTVIGHVLPDGALRLLSFSGNPGRIQLNPTWFEAGRRFLASGVEHIVGGIDHLLFLVCLVVPFRRTRDLVLIVTAFTVAHSVTLVSAALGWVPSGLWFPPFIETIIAASIVWMALENIVGATNLRRRWVLTALFGLAHGFGFSFALAELLQFSGRHLATSLVAFNLGVELGQLAVILLIVPLLRAAFRWGLSERVGTIVISALVAHQAWHWMSERWTDLLAHEIPTPSAMAWAWMLRVAVVAWIVAGVWLWRKRGTERLG